VLSVLGLFQGQYSNACSWPIIKFAMAHLQIEDVSKTQLFAARKGWKEHCWN